MTTDPITTGGIGSGWPDPTEPGVPAEALHDGYHWLQWQDHACAFIGQWSPDSWSWIVAQRSDRMCPEEADHLNYIGPCPQPGGLRPAPLATNR